MKQVRKRVVFVGRLSFNNTPCAGEVKKNQLLLKRLQEFKELDVQAIDTINCQGRFSYAKALLSIIIKSHCGKKTIILSTFDGSACVFLRFFKKFGLKKNILYWVIGGGIGKKIIEGQYPINLFKTLDHIIVEDKDIELQMKDCGLKQVRTVPNFKPIPVVQKKKSNSSTFKFLYLSRITPLKGCDMIIAAAKQLERKNIQLSIDFYGPIENDYPFMEYIEKVSCISYKGFLSLESHEVFVFISQYDALLFPTYYPNEGFPGVMIDGFIAGLPIITTNWRYNSHIVEHGKTGWLLPIQDSEALANLMEEIVIGKHNLSSMANNCFIRAKEFDTKSVITIELLTELGLL